jgi:hypothetical protein
MLIRLSRRHSQYRRHYYSGARRCLAIKAPLNIETALPERSSRMTVRYGNIDYQTSVQERARFSIRPRLESRRGQFFMGRT